MLAMQLQQGLLCVRQKVLLWIGSHLEIGLISTRSILNTILFLASSGTLYPVQNSSKLNRAAIQIAAAACRLHAKPLMSPMHALFQVLMTHHEPRGATFLT
jgi:hypothetical protein